MSLYIGLISGTSMDSLDAVLVDFSTVTPKLIETTNLAFPSELKAKFREVIGKAEVSFEELADFDIAIARLSTLAVKRLLETAGKAASDVRAIGSHGQTLFHIPGKYSLQVGDPNRIAFETGIKTIGDFRRMDIAAGGQGAPLAPLFHREVFGKHVKATFVVNLGGIANITYLPEAKNESIVGFDTGPANTLLDKWHEMHRDSAFDVDGRWAKSGKILTPLLQHLLLDEYFQAPPPKSTGPEHFNIEWLKKHLDGDERTEDVQATLVELTAASVAQAIKSFVPDGQVVVCGGGAHNVFLMERLKEHLNEFQFDKTDAFGVSADWMEAMCFAWLAKKHLDNEKLDTTSVTGAARDVHLGGSFG